MEFFFLTNWGLNKMADIFANDIFECIFLNEDYCILIKDGLKNVPMGPIKNPSALLLVMAWQSWHRTGLKPLCDLMLMVLCDTIWRHWAIINYRQTSNIRCTLVENKIVDHSDVVGASPVGAAPTTSSISKEHLVSMVWAKTTARLPSFGIWCAIYCRFDGKQKIP